MNTVTDFLSRLEADPIEKEFLKIRKDMTIKPSEVNIEPTGILPGGRVFNADDDLTNT